VFVTSRHLFNTGGMHRPANYRPRLIENEVYTHMLKYVEHHKVLTFLIHHARHNNN